MGVLGLAQPLALSAPASNSALPFPLFINGNESSLTGPDAYSYRLRDPGFSGPQTLSFTIRDKALAYRPWLAKAQRVIWSASASGAVLFQGYIADLRYRPIATWVDIDVTCTHISAALDYAIPITTWDAGAHGRTDQAEIGALLGAFSQEMHLGSGGYIQVLNGAMPASTPTDRTTLRNAIEKVLDATGVAGAVAYVDSLGYLHTMASGDTTAPYAISDAPNYTTTVPAAIEVMDQGAPYVDYLYVYGGTATGSGPIPASACGIAAAPASPARWAVLDAPQATTQAGAVAAATSEFQRRQNAVAVTITVSGDRQHGSFDGWAKGQLVTVTNAALGWSARQLTVSAVDMEVISGDGQRRYTITAGSDPVLFTARLKWMQAKSQFVQSQPGALRGRIGGALP